MLVLEDPVRFMGMISGLIRLMYDEHLTALDLHSLE